MHNYKLLKIQVSHCFSEGKTVCACLKMFLVMPTPQLTNSILAIQPIFDTRHRV